MDVITYQNCPGCGNGDIGPKLTVKDHSVTGEQFAIWQCAGCTLRFTQNVPSAQTIGRYYQSENYISHTDTRKGIINSLYHIVRNRTLKGKKSLIGQGIGKRTGSLLDIGAGTGAFCAYMSRQGWAVTGLEPDEATRDRARALYGITLQPSEMLQQHPAGSFDAITLWHVLEHVHDLHMYLDRIKQLLKPGGRAFIAVPNYTSYDAQSYQAYWAAYDVPRHLYHFSPAAMRRLLQQHGLKLRGVEPMWFDSFYVSMLSEQYRKGKPAYLSALVTGLLSNLRALRHRERCSSLIYILENAG